MAETQDAASLKRRARRRLVGAIALVVLIVIVLPIVLEKEPKPASQDLVIQIPRQDTGRFNTRLLAPAAGEKGAPGDSVQPKAVSRQPAPAAEARSESASRPAQDAKAAPGAEPAAASREAEAKRAQAILEGGAYVVPLGSYGKSENVKQLQAKLAAAGVRSFTETLQGPQGEQTRVRAGPFESRDAAEKMREKLKSMGLDAGPVAPR